MLFKETGFAKDGQGKTIRIVAADLPGLYPVLGVQLKNDGTGVAKDGVRLYTKGGRVYANGSTDHPLNLQEYTSAASANHTPSRVTMVYRLDGRELGRTEVEEGSDAHEELFSNGWEEVSA